MNNAQKRQQTKKGTSRGALRQVLPTVVHERRMVSNACKQQRGGLTPTQTNPRTDTGTEARRVLRIDTRLSSGGATWLLKPLFG